MFLLCPIYFFSFRLPFLVLKMPSYQWAEGVPAEVGGEADYMEGYAPLACGAGRGGTEP